MATSNITGDNQHTSESQQDRPTDENVTTTEYCRKLQEWMWQYYCGYVNWQIWTAISAPPFPPCYFPHTVNSTPAATLWPPGHAHSDASNWHNNPFIFASPHSFSPAFAADARTEQVTAGASVTNTARPVQITQNGNVHQRGQEYAIPSPLRRFLAETVDFIILFCVKATIVLGIMQLSGAKDFSKFAMHYIVGEVVEDTSLEDLQKIMMVALIYRVLVCFYEIACISGVDGATPGKFLLGLQVVSCDTSVPVQSSRVRVVPASSVSLSASTVRALIKNFSIPFLFPAFITLLFFQHNRTVYDVVAGTIVVKRVGTR
ncbi:protein FAM8A1 isoform X1 [Anguilla rostrata]|uniref:protein FAM8A1 isoform X1 n=1 Tax=Anguilla rostrata TaxID=7938 RepID=UPI0030CFDB77